MREKKVLIIASEFPPRGVGNILRTVKLVKHLSSFGWQPYVLTVSSGSIEKYDHSYDNEIPKETCVTRALYPNPFIFLDRRWHNRATIQKRLSSVNTQKNTDEATRKSHNLSIKSLILSLILFIRKSIRLVLFPGELVLWIPFAVIKGIFITINNKIDFIYSSAPSYENHLVGLFIKIFTGRKWMADYRDLWTDYPTRRISSKFRKKIEERLESAVLKNADAVNIASPMWREFLLKKFSFLKAEKVTCYTNGYDSEDYVGETQNKHKDSTTMKMIYAGSILQQYPLPLFLKAFGELCSEIPSMTSDASVEIYGHINDEQLTQSQKIIEELSLQGNASINGSLPRQDVLRIMEKSDLLLLMYIDGVMNVEGCIPAKLFEYIGIQKPIFAMIPKNGSAAEIIRNGNIGMVVSPSSYDEIKDGLRELYLNHKLKNDSFNPDWNYLRQYDRKHIVGELVHIFDHLAFK